MANTTLLGFVLPTSGSLTGTWGTTVNTQLTQLVEDAIAGTTTITADADVTLSSSPLVANQARQPVILWTATGSTTRNITAPAQSKVYIVVNSTGGTQSIVFKASGTTGVTVPAGTAAVVAWDGSDFVCVSTHATSLSLGSPLTVPNGGTGAATLTGLVKAAGTAAMTAVTAPAGDVVGTTDIQTMTNKRVTKRVNSIVSAATITPTSDTVDQYNVTALAVPATVANPSGSPTDGQYLVLRMKDAGVAQPLTWGTMYRAFGDALPSSTTANKIMYLRCTYNAADSKWDVFSAYIEN